jgi:hypothetical protein
VLIIEINVVRSETLEGLLNYFPDVLWLAVDAAAILVVVSELACDSDLVADRRERCADKLFVDVRSINFGCIKERDAFFVGCTNDFNALVSICGGAVVGANTHAPKPHFRHF